MENIVLAILVPRGPVSQNSHDPPPPYNEQSRHDHGGIPSFSLLTVHATVLMELANHSLDFVISDIKTEWNIVNFMHASFERTQPLDRVLILIDISNVVQAATCIKRITSRWGGFEFAILEFVNSMLRGPRRHTVRESAGFPMSGK